VDELDERLACGLDVSALVHLASCLLDGVPDGLQSQALSGCLVGNLVFYPALQVLSQFLTLYRLMVLSRQKAL
jgi:hypothetical protein